MAAISSLLSLLLTWGSKVLAKHHEQRFNRGYERKISSYLTLPNLIKRIDYIIFVRIIFDSCATVWDPRLVNLTDYKSEKSKDVQHIF